MFSFLNVLKKFACSSSKEDINLCAMAVKDAVLLALPISALKSVLEKHPDSLIDVVKIIGFRLQRVTLFTLKAYFGLSSELLFENTTNMKGDIEYLGGHSFSYAQNFKQLQNYKICFINNCDSSSSNDSCAETTHPCKLIFDPASEACNCCTMKRSLDKFRQLLDLDEDLVPTASIKTIHFKKNALILSQGHAVDDLYFVVCGLVSVEEKCEIKNISKKIGSYASGKFLGSLSILSGESCMFTYIASTGCVLLAISRCNLFSAIKKKPEIVVKLGANIIKDLSLLVQQVDFGLDWMQLEAGSILYKQGDSSESAFVVLTGRLQSTTLHSTRSMLTGEYGRGEIVGLAETLTQSLRGSNVMAIRDTELASLSEGLILFIKHCHPDSVTSLIYLMGQKILKSLSGDNNIFTMISNFSNMKENIHLGKISTIALLTVSNSVSLPSFASLFQKALNATGGST